MKKLIYGFGITLALASGSMAQVGKPTTLPVRNDSAAKAMVAEHFAEVLKNLPEGVAEKIIAARDASKAAKADIDAMKANGKTPAEVEAMINEKRTAALLNLQKALDVLNGLPDGAKERVTKAKEVISKRLEERKADAKAQP